MTLRTKFAAFALVVSLAACSTTATLYPVDGRYQNNNRYLFSLQRWTE